MIQILFLFTILLQIIKSQWVIQHRYAYRDTLQPIINPKSNSCKYTDYLINSYVLQNAYYINCTSPLSNYITLNQFWTEVSNCDYEKFHETCRYYCSYKCLISFDLYYQGTQVNNILKFKLYNNSYDYLYTSPSDYFLEIGFCDNKKYEIKQINITQTQQSLLNFTISTNLVGDGQVSLKNLYILNYQFNCYPRCSTCAGPEYNQCLTCFYGTQQNQNCPSCPSDYYYVQYEGCRPKCNFIDALCLNGFCKLCSSYIQYSTNLSNSTEQIFWSIIYDNKLPSDTPLPQLFWLNQFVYGIFKYNYGISRFIYEIVPKVGYYIGLKIQLILFDDLPLDCGIHFKFNRTYYGSIFNTSSGIKLHNFTSSNCTKYEYTNNNYLCEIYGYFDIPQYPFLFTAIGNLTHSQAGWGMIGIQITTDYCTDYCLVCDVSYKCKICESPYILYRDGTCIFNCDKLYQVNNGTYCKDFDDETPYSELIISENINHTFEYNSQYKLTKQVGTNFLKGQNLYYSFWNGYPIFGGSFIWAQAQFERIHFIDRPHHSISIEFYIQYGPKFPQESQFILTIDENTQFIKHKNESKELNDDGTFLDIISEKITHNLNTLNITIECKGENEPIKAFCGLYNFYLAVHYCQPYCNKCTDHLTCQEWNSTDYLTKIQFSQIQCQTKQYFNIHQSLCFDCPSSCKSCTSKIVCQECKDSYKLTNLGCFCTKGQYEESNFCNNCPVSCNQCLSNSQCIECTDRVNMILTNGQCNCIAGYSLNSDQKLCTSSSSATVIECQPSCEYCALGKCYQCDYRWDVDPIQYSCKEKCGDFIQLDTEQCESSFILPYRGCYNCKPRCQSSCLNCGTTGQGCLKCIEGYSLVDNLCYPICGDLIVTFDEQCDDGNLIYGDGCHFCQYSCQDSCQNCINGICFNFSLDHPLTTIQCNPLIRDEIYNNSQLCNLIGELYLQSELYNFNFACDINCNTCFFKICYICKENYLLSIDSRQCVEITSLFNYQFENCLIKIGSICFQCNAYAYFDNIEQKCKPNLSNLKSCQYQMIQSPNQFCNYCFENCFQCSYDSCIQCKKGYYFDDQMQCISNCGDGILTENEQCEVNDQNCISCEYQKSQHCLNYHQELCLQCQLGFHYNLMTKICESQCGDGIKTEDEDCDIADPNINVDCQKLKFYCNTGCNQCKDGLCLSCNQGYILLNNFCYFHDLRIENHSMNMNDQSMTELLRNEKPEKYCLSNPGYYLALAFNQCIPICGDGIITQDEECDDKFIIQSHLCFNCKFQCPIDCLTCQFGQCLQCNQGFQIQGNKCYPKCSDKIIKSDKFCDDNNNIQFDGCYKCQNSCQIECLFCLDKKCIECISGWNLIGGRCYQICGDSQVAIMSEEQCDDPQNLNCRNCQLYTCNENCKLCNNQQQCIICDDQFKLVNSTCINICGDGIIKEGFEECDDGNEIEFDGCHNCKYSYSCGIGCLICQENNICLECNSQEYFTLDSKTNQCISQDNQQDEEVQITDSEDQTNQEEIQIIVNDYQESEVNCGNSKLQSNLNEECDDGNLVGGDGCSETCVNELSFKCQNIENEKSECSYIQTPNFYLNVISNSQSSLQIVDLTFSQQVKLNQNNTIESIVDFEIKPETKYNLTIIPLLNLTTEQQMSHYQFSISFEQSVDHPVFTIRFKENSIINSENIPLKSPQKSIQIGNPFVLSDSTKKKLAQIISMNDVIMYTMISISTLSFLIGNPDMFFNLLNLLQSFSYIRYVQYQFPPHLQQFLETYSKISLKLALDYLKIDQFLTQLNGGNFPQSHKTTLQTKEKNQINPTFLVNASSCYISVLTSYLTYLISKVITSKQIDNFLNKVFQLKCQNIKYLQLIRFFQKKIQQKCLKLRLDYFSKIIFQVYFTILHQLLFSTFLQFPKYSFQTFFEALNSVNSLFTMGLIIFINFKSLSITSQKIKNVSKWKYFFEESKSQFWAANFKPMQLYRVTIYIFLIVFFINQPEIQVVLLSLQSLIYLLYLHKVQPLKSKSEYIKLILREFLFLSTVGSFLIYNFNLTEDQYIFCGWIHISMLSTILGTNLLVDMIEFLCKLHANYLKKKLKLERQQQNNILSPPQSIIVNLKMQNLNNALSNDQFNLDLSKQ